MSISQRPVHPPTSVPAIAPVEPVASDAPPSTAPVRAARNADVAPVVDRPPKPSVRSASARRPLYRREPWLAALLASLLIMVASVFLPTELQAIARYVGFALGALGIVLLVMHKPDPDEEARWREYQRRGD